MYRGRGFLPPAGASFFITVSGAGAFGGAGGDYARHAQERVKLSEQRLSRVWGCARPWQLAEPRTIEAHSRTAVTDRYQTHKAGRAERDTRFRKLPSVGPKQRASPVVGCVKPSWRRDRRGGRAATETRLRAAYGIQIRSDLTTSALAGKSMGVSDFV